MKYSTVEGKINLSFGKAFDVLRELDAQEPNKYGMRLNSWKDDVVIRIQNPDDNSYMTAPYLYVQSRYGRVPWKETMIELFSDSWYIVKFDEIGEPELIKELTDVKEDYTYNNKVEDLSNKYYRNLYDKDRQKVNQHGCSFKCLKKCLNECNKTDIKKKDSTKQVKPRRSMHLVAIGEITDDDIRTIIDEFF